MPLSLFIIPLLVFHPIGIVLFGLLLSSLIFQGESHLLDYLMVFISSLSGPAIALAILHSALGRSSPFTTTVKTAAFCLALLFTLSSTSITSLKFNLSLIPAVLFNSLGAACISVGLVLLAIAAIEVVVSWICRILALPNSIQTHTFRPIIALVAIGVLFSTFGEQYYSLFLGGR